MQGSSGQKKSVGIEAWAAELACPVCYGEVRFSGDRVTCVACGRAYPVEEGIPVLIAERAEMPGSRQS